MDMHDGLLNCFLTFEKFESETIMEAISRKVWIHGPKPFGTRTKNIKNLGNDHSQQNFENLGPIRTGQSVNH